MNWWSNDPVVEDEPKAGQGDWWKADPVIGEELSDSNPSVRSEPTGPHYVPAEMQQFAEQAAIEQNEGNYQVPEWLREVVPQAIKFPAKVAIAGGAMQTGRLHWPTDEEVETPLLSPEVSRGVLAVSSGGLSEMARAAQSRYPQNALAQVAGGVTEGVTDAVSGFSSPENLALLPIAPGGKLAQRAIAGVFLGQAISGTPEQWEAFNNAPELSDKIRIATSMGLGYGLPALGVAHSFRKPPKVVEPVRTTQEQSIPATAPIVEPPIIEPRPTQPRKPADLVSEEISAPPLTREGISQPEFISPAVEEARSKTVRLYHGGTAEQAGRDFTPFPEYAKGYADKAGEGGKVWYIDVPEGLLKTHDEYGVPVSRVIVPDEIANQAKILSEPQPIQPGIESALAEIQRRNAPESVVEPSGTKIGSQEVAAPVAIPPKTTLPPTLESTPVTLQERSTIPQSEITPTSTQIKGQKHAIPENRPGQVPESIGPDIQREASETLLRNERIQGAAETEPGAQSLPRAVEKAPEVTPPIRISKIGRSIEAKAVEAKLTQGFEGTANFDPITVKDQAQMATGLIKSSLDNARAVIRGEAPLPEGLRGTSLITAMEEHITRQPSAELAYELANSPLVRATSEAAQEMRLMAERVPDSITSTFQEIREARRAGSKQRGETPERIIQEIKTEVVRNSSKRPTWEAFVRSIECPV